MGWADDLIAGPMGYKYAVLFPRAREAIYHASAFQDIDLPSNICRAIFETVGRTQLIPVWDNTGMAPDIPVQLYGYREICENAELEIDPLMTGWLGRPFAKSSIVSFGHKKMVTAYGGGAFLTSHLDLAEQMKEHSYWPEGLTAPVALAIHCLPTTIAKRFEKIALWDRHLGDSCIRIPREQVMPWRCMRRIPFGRDKVVRALRDAGFDAGTNYPPLPGVTDAGAHEWGGTVINFFVSDDYDEPRIRAACEIVKRTIGQ